MWFARNDPSVQLGTLHIQSWTLNGQARLYQRHLGWVCCRPFSMQPMSFIKTNCQQSFPEPEHKGFMSKLRHSNIDLVCQDKTCSEQTESERDSVISHWCSGFLVCILGSLVRWGPSSVNQPKGKMCFLSMMTNCIWWLIMKFEDLSHPSSMFYRCLSSTLGRGGCWSQSQLS